jgi:tetratricopeptide (TPR) repeat protein
VTSADDKGNTLERVEAMVKEKGEAGMGYTVAWDDGTKTKEAIFKAAGQRGIPCSFVVDGNGTIAYIGHPMWLDKPLAQITKGTWDHTKGMAEIEAAQKKLGEVSQVGQTDPARGLAMLRELEKDNPGVADVMFVLKFRFLLSEGSAASKEEAKALVTKALDGNDAAKLGSMARMLAPPNTKPSEENLALALRASHKAVALTDEKNVSHLEGLAKIYFAKGDYEKAIEWQRKAVALTPESRKPAMEKILAEYEQAARG